MEFAKFVNRLRQVNEAFSVKDKHYTGIRVTGNQIEYIRETGSRESIDIHDLLDVYNVEEYINITILQNYIKGRKYSPALAILIAAGFYNEKGARISEEGIVAENTDSETVRAVILRLKKGRLKVFIELIKELNKLIKERLLKITLKRLVASVFLIFPFAIILTAIYIYYPDQGITSALIWISVILVIINTAFFLYLIIFKKDSFQEKTYTAYFTLMIFNIGIFPLFNYIKDYQERNKVEVVYTAGFRAWGSTVRFSDIKVSFYDKFGNPFSLDKSEIDNSKNWITGIWHEDNLPNMQDSASDFKVSKGQLIVELTNCGAVLNPKLFEKHKATSFYIDAKIELLEIDSVIKILYPKEQYYSAQFCLNIPYEKPKHRYNSIYNAFELSFFNFTTSKLRIPGLNFDYTMAELDYQNRYESNLYTRNVTDSIAIRILNFEDGKQIKPISENTIIHLSAVDFNNDAAFYIIKENGSLSLPLFNFNTKKYGAFSLSGE